MSSSVSKFNPSKWFEVGGKWLMIAGLLMAVLLPAAQPVAAYTGIPTFTIIDVIKDTSVSIETHNFPADETFKVLMGPIGTLGIDGTEVATTETGDGGTFEATYDIPEELQGFDLIAIRLESESGYYSYNWFVNDDETVTEETEAETATEEATTTTEDVEETDTTEVEETEETYTGIPTFSVLEVAGGKSVKISAVGFPVGTDFTVLMGEYGTKAIGGVEAGEINTGETGEFEEELTIPKSLAGIGMIAIRMESVDGYYFSYNWFFNVSTTVTPTEETVAEATEETEAETTATPEAAEAETEETTESTYEGIPTFSISSVESDVQVVVQIENLPANDTFTVRMGVFGSRAIDGVEVGTLETGEGGSLEKTYKIPADLAGSDLIAIRMDSESGYYTYNWFGNKTYPVAVTEPAAETEVVAETETSPEYYPTFSISSVEKNTTVTILTDDFPPDVDFTVFMGPMGSMGIDGIEVGTTESGEGGTLDLSFDIPADYADNSPIAIRFDSTDGVYSCYNWFYNN